jgi:hypothetical protein
VTAVYNNLRIFAALYSSVIDSRTDSPATAASYSSRRGRKTAPVYERRNRETTRKGPPVAAAVDSPFRGDHRSLALAQSLSSLTVQGGGGDGTKNGALDHESVVANSPPGNMTVLSVAALDASSQSGCPPAMETGPGNQSDSSSARNQPGSGSSSGGQMRSGGQSQQSEAKGKENTPQLDVHGNVQ